MKNSHSSHSFYQLTLLHNIFSVTSKECQVWNELLKWTGLKYYLLNFCVICWLQTIRPVKTNKQTNSPQYNFWQVISAFTLFRKPDLFILLWFLRHSSSWACLHAFWLIVSISSTKKIIWIGWIVTCKQQGIGYSILEEIRKVKFLDEYYQEKKDVMWESAHPSSAPA